MNNIETMKLALEALIWANKEINEWMDDQGLGPIDHPKIMSAITALLQAIEQAQQAEPDYYGLTKDHLWMSITKDHYDRLKPEFRMACYTSPPLRQPLTDEEKDKLANAWFSKDGDTDVLHRKAIALIEEVEAAVWEKQK